MTNILVIVLRLSLHFHNISETKSVSIFRWK